MLKIDWENYEVIESEDYTEEDVEATIENAREELNWIYPSENAALEDLYDKLIDMRDKGVEYGED